LNTQFSALIPLLEKNAIEAAGKLRDFRRCEFYAPIEAAAKEELRKLREFRRSESHANWLFQSKKLEAAGNAVLAEQNHTLEKLQGRVDRSWFHAWKKLREAVLEVLTCEYIPAFHLGECIDGLLSPTDRFAFVYDDA